MNIDKVLNETKEEDHVVQDQPRQDSSRAEQKKDQSTAYDIERAATKVIAETVNYFEDRNGKARGGGIAMTSHCTGDDGDSPKEKGSCHDTYDDDNDGIEMALQKNRKVSICDAARLINHDDNLLYDKENGITSRIRNDKDSYSYVSKQPDATVSSSNKGQYKYNYKQNRAKARQSSPRDIFDRRCDTSKQKTKVDDDDSDEPQYIFDSYSDDIEDNDVRLGSIATSRQGTKSLGDSNSNNRKFNKNSAVNDYEEDIEPGIVHVPIRAPGFRTWSFKNRLSRYQKRRQQMPIKTIQDNNEDDQIEIARVVDVQVEKEALDRKVEEAIRNSATTHAEEININVRKRRLIIIGSIGAALFIACAILSVILLTLNRESHNDKVSTATLFPTISPSRTPKTTLTLILERGVLKCGVPPIWPGFVEINEKTGEREGFEIDLCRAIAAAVIGSNYSIEAIELPWSERFVSLANKSVDLLAQGTTHTMERDVHQSGAEEGFSFSVPYMYDGLGFGGKSFFVNCADNIQAYGDCSELSICVMGHTTHYNILADLFPSGSLVTSSDRIDSIKRFISGDCNVLAGEKTAISEQLVRAQDYKSQYAVGDTLLSKEPIAIVSREGDHEWSQIINWVLQAQFLAEAMNITKDTAGDFSKVSPYEDEYNKMFINALSAVGNYGEQYERHLDQVYPRQGLNKLYVSDNGLANGLTNNGLIYSYPFGSIEYDGPEPTIGSQLNTIFEHRKLRCGVREIRDGFARFNTASQEWKGLDIDYCNAIAAAMFGGVIHSTVEYVNLTTKSTFDALINYDVDVVCGVDIDIEANIEMGISFSQPYFYEGEYSSRTLATFGKDDPQFSDFVWWVVTATFFAEEENITRSTSNDMPEVNLFGPRYHRMFRDAILITGNYGNLYEKNLGTIIPRSGRNNLNNPMIGPQINPNVGF